MNLRLSPEPSKRAGEYQAVNVRLELRSPGAFRHFLIRAKSLFAKKPFPLHPSTLPPRQLFRFSTEGGIMPILV
jgi:hypothetical protein